MFVHVVHVRRIAEESRGTRLEAVVCEKCRTSYWYELTRVSVGKAWVLYGLYEEAASRRAKMRADQNLQWRLDIEAELVPCPKCRWVNQPLVDKAGNTFYRGAPMLIFAIMTIGAAVGLIGWVEYLAVRNLSAQSIAILRTVVAVCWSSPLWVLLIRRELRRRLNPNRSYPNGPPPPPGTPPALIEVIDPESGGKYLRAAPGAAASQYQNGHWAVLRPGKLNFPRVCCICLEDAPATYWAPVTMDNNSDISAPLCRPCLRRLRRKWWIILLDSVALSFVAGCLLVHGIDGLDDRTRWILTGFVTFVGAIVGVVIASSVLCRPYRMRIIDKDRGIMRFKAINPQFTQLVIANAMTADGVVED